LLQDRPGDLGRERLTVGVRIRGLRARETQPLEEDERVGDAHLDDLADGAPGDRDRQALRAKPGAAARVARAEHHVLAELLAHGVGTRLLVAPRDVGEDALPRLGVMASRAAGAIREADLLPARPVEDDVPDLLR